jgi:hypothetical protein
LHDPADAFIILTIVLVSGPLGFWQERGAIITLDFKRCVPDCTSGVQPNSVQETYDAIRIITIWRPSIFGWDSTFAISASSNANLFRTLAPSS